MQDCQTHLNSAAQSLHRNRGFISINPVPPQRERTGYIAKKLVIPLASPYMAPSCQPNSSSMEQKALCFFRALLVWNDILSCSAKTMAPSRVEAYRNLLADEQFAQDFRDIIGCETWVLVTIMDATNLEIWKRDQDARGILSIRELIKRVNEIEAVLEQGIRTLSRVLQISPVAGIACSETSQGDRYYINTYIFAHAVLIHLHSIVSGSRPGVPEIQQSVDKAISAWSLCPLSINPGVLAWPYCVSASLAVDSQRDIFRNLIPETSPRESAFSSLVHSVSVVKECWRDADACKDRQVSCDWKEAMQRLNLSILFL